MAMLMGGDIANSIFVIITGYLMYNKQFHIKRIVKLWLEVEFYSIISYVIATVMGIEKVSLKSVIYAFLPVGACTYWFFSTYFVMSFFFPLFNFIVRSLDKKNLKGILIVGIIFFSVLPTLGYGASWLEMKGQFPMFGILYLFGAYVKKYNLAGCKRRRCNLMLFIIIGLACMASVPLCATLKLYPLKMIWGFNKTFMPIMGGLLFLFFKGINVSYRINSIGRSIFGVYLFHYGKLLYPIINGLGLTAEMYYTKKYILYMIFGVIAIFIISTVVDIIRIHTVEKLLMNILDTKIEALNLRFASWIDV